MICETCEDTGWVCEACDTRWELAEGGTCCGAGQNCACNLDGVVEFEVVHATTNPDEVKTWAH